MSGTDIFGELLAASFRGVPFPVVDMTWQFGQDHAPHLWPDRDGGHIEATGRRPAEHRIKIPFRNGVVAASGERWKGRVLYPDVFRDFIGATADKSSGLLSHPEWGILTAKAHDVSVAWDGRRRDGVDVDVTFVESDDDEDSLANRLTAPSPIASAVAEAGNLDTLLGQMDPPWEYPKYTPTFRDMMRSIQAALDAPGQLSRQVSGAIGSVSSAIQNVADAMDRLDSSINWPIQQSLERLRAAVNDLKAGGSAKGRAIVFYTTLAPTTLTKLARQLGQSIADMIALNKVLAEQASVPVGSRVAYYASASQLLSGAAG